MNNPVYIGTAFNKQVRFYFANSKELVNELIKMGSITPVSLIALADSMTITGIMGLMEKSQCKITSIINGDGECGKIICQADNLGKIRGLVSNRYVDLPLKNNHFDIVGGVGNIGNIEITKDYGLKTPYYSETSIIKGDILTDYSYYYAYSQQTQTAICGGVNLDSNYNASGAGILMMQLLPDCNEEIIDKLEAILTSGFNLSNMLSTMTYTEILDQIFSDYEILETKNLELYCDCSYEKCISSINLLPDEDKKEILEDEKIEMVCDWCQSKYDIKKDDIKLQN